MLSEMQVTLARLLAMRYEAVADSLPHRARPCIHGHLDCALKTGGFCADEQLGQLEAVAASLLRQAGQDPGDMNPLDALSEAVYLATPHNR